MSVLFIRYVHAEADLAGLRGARNGNRAQPEEDARKAAPALAMSGPPGDESKHACDPQNT
jgi:hypothetical protein